jgi:hypothetical protein
MGESILSWVGIEGIKLSMLNISYFLVLGKSETRQNLGRVSGNFHNSGKNIMLNTGDIA